MTVRIIEIDGLSSAEKEIARIGSDLAGIKLMSPKAFLRAVKINSVKPAAANIIKQEMLSCGGEAATAYGAINHSVKTSDVLILGTLKQLRQLTNKLFCHPFGLPEIAVQINRCLENYEQIPSRIKIGSKSFDFGRRTYLMGILNITPDSFSDGGNFYRLGDAVRQAEGMLEEGADIIDVGGESTRPGAKPVQKKEEMKRIVPVIKALSKNKGIIISVDTRKWEVAKAALDAGAHMVNDVSGLRFDPKMAGVVAEARVPLCVMHMRGTPETMQRKPTYFDLIGEIISSLEQSIAIAKNTGILHEKIIIDPGIGFGKTVENNLEILKRLRELKILGCPILVGPSRKSMIGEVLKLPVAERKEGTAAAVVIAIANGANIVRVHDVREMRRAVKMTDAIVKQR